MKANIVICLFFTFFFCIGGFIGGHIVYKQVSGEHIRQIKDCAVLIGVMREKVEKTR